MFKLKKGNIQLLSFIQDDQHVKVEKEAKLAGNEQEVSNNSNIRKQQYCVINTECKDNNIQLQS